MSASSPGVYRGSGEVLSVVGHWTVTVVVERGQGSVEVPLDVDVRG